MAANRILHNTSFFSDKIISTIPTIAFLNRQKVATLKSLGVTAKSPLLDKKQKHYNAFLFLDNKKCPPLDK